MGTIVEKMNYTKTNIERLKDLTNESVLENVVDNVEQNYGKGSEWQSQEDWWDIDTILKNDIENFPAKMIVLLTDGVDTSTFKMNTTNKIAKVKTSDGGEYMETATHIWDKRMDKVCSVGYKTRYYIVYFSDTSSTIVYDELPTAASNNNSFSNLYIVVKDLELTIQTRSGTSWFNKNCLLECVKCINSRLAGNEYFANNNYNLKQLDDIMVSNGNRTVQGCSNLMRIGKVTLLEMVIGMDYMFGSVFSLREIPYIDTSNIQNFSSTFNGAYGVQRIKSLNFISATNVSNVFRGCSELISIEEILNIRISGLDFSFCVLLNHDTLMRILNALYDYSDDTENTHTVVLGSVNIAKLTDEELAIAQNKGWTVS